MNTLIYTSYFANIRNMDLTKIVPISIAQFNPQWYTGLSYKKLAPKKALLNAYKLKRISTTEYTEIYTALTLSMLNPVTVVAKLMELSHYKPVALICYETIGEFCHRHLAAHWLNTDGAEYGIIREWNKDGNHFIHTIDPNSIIQPKEAYSGHI